MDSSRIIINNYDLSTSTEEATTSIVGCTVVAASKGPKTPVRIPAGGLAKLEDIFGKPSDQYPELAEAWTYASDYDLYLAAPYYTATVPVALITDEGVLPSNGNITYDTNFEDYINGDTSKKDAIKTVITSTPANRTTFLDIKYPKSYAITTTSSDQADYYPTISSGVLTIKTNATFSELTGKFDTDSFKFTIKDLPVTYDGNLEELTFEVVYNTTAYGDIKLDTTVVGSATVTDNIVYLNLGNTETSTTLKTYIAANLASETARKNLRIGYNYVVAADSIYGVIFPKYPSERSLHIGFEAFDSNVDYAASDVASRNIFKITAYEDGAFHNASHSVYFEGSLNEILAENSSSTTIYGFNSKNETYTSQNLVGIAAFKYFKLASELKNTSLTGYPAVLLEKGTRDTTSTPVGGSEDSLYNYSWSIISADTDTFSSVNVFFESRRHDSTKTINTTNAFFSLDETFPLAGFIYNYTLSPTEVTSTSSTPTVLSYGQNYWNVCNEAVIELSSGSQIMSPLTAAEAVMISKIIEYRYGGAAPMYINSGTPAVGGQLSIANIGAILRLRYKYDKGCQKTLNTLNYNPIIKDPQYGVMVVGHKTGKPGAATDWSYIGHVASFLTFEREVRENVMIPQLGKPNNPYYRDLRKQQVEAILAKRLEGSTRIWAAGSVDTSTADGVNDIAAQRARKFIINVRVKVDTFSEIVELNFTNVDAGMEV